MGRKQRSSSVSFGKPELKLVKLSLDGKNYTLTDEGKAALRLIAEVIVSKSKIVVKPQSSDVGLFNRRQFFRTAIVTLVILLICFGAYSGIVLAFSSENNIFQSSNCTKLILGRVFLEVAM